MKIVEKPVSPLRPLNKEDREGSYSLPNMIDFPPSACNPRAGATHTQGPALQAGAELGGRQKLFFRELSDEDKL